MRHTMRRLSALFLILALLLSLAACGETPEQTVAKAQENLAKAGSSHAESNMEMSMTAGGQTVDMTVAMKGDTTIEPSMSHYTMEINMGQIGKQTTEFYLQKTEDDQYTAYLGTVGSDGTTAWQKTTVDPDDYGKQFDAAGQVGDYLGGLSAVQKGEKETAAGVEAVRYTAVISSDKLSETLKNAGLTEQFTALLGMDAEKASAMMDGLDDVPVTLWISKKTTMPVRCEVDLTAMMQSLMTQALSDQLSGTGETIEIGKFKVTTELSNIGGVAAITVPEDALAGSELGT